MQKEEQIFADFLSRNGLRVTEQRLAIFRAFYTSDRHLSAEEIYDIVKRSKTGVGIATVWRNMKLIREAGLADEHQFRDGRIRYEKRTPKDHGHMICIVCNRPVEFDTKEIVPILKTVSEANGFAIDEVKITIFGKCFLCRGQRPHTKGDSDPGAGD
jgi:Fur family ferric uptake transcriptional regulator